MSAQTSRLKLTKPGGGSHGTITPGDPVDIDVLNDNADILDGAVGALSVTSTTRPATPFVGQLIYETDTQRLERWDGTAWGLAHQVAGAKGAFVNTGTITFGSTATIASTLTVISLVANHVYIIGGSLLGTMGSQAGTPTISLRADATAGSPGSGTFVARILDGVSYAIGATVQGTGMGVYVPTANKANVNFILSGSLTQSSLVITAGQMSFFVIDMGPVFNI